MSRTLATQPDELRCSNPECNRHNPVLAKSDGIKCRCGAVTPIPIPIPIHFYPNSALGGGSIEADWARHRKWAKEHGCQICGIEADPPAPGPVGSHTLAAKYPRVPSSLDTRGTDYTLPVFPPCDPKELSGKRVLVISADGPELPEIDVPIEYLRARGAQVDLAAQDWTRDYRNPPLHIVLAEWLSDAICVKADMRISDAKIDDYDALFIPGGAWNPDMLRTDDAALKLVREAHAEGVLVVSLCHGPQVLISAAFDAPAGQKNFPSAGINITGVGSIRRDLKNAGFVVHDQDATVYDANANLLTARDPNDLGALCEHFGKLLKQRADKEQ
jgi:protease I